MALQPHKPCLTDKDPLMFDTNPSYLWQTAPAFCSSRILCQPSVIHYNPLSLVCTTSHKVISRQFVSLIPVLISQTEWTHIKE